MKNIKALSFLILSIIPSYFWALPISAQTDLSQQNFSVSLERTHGSFEPATTSYLGTQIGAGPNIFNFVELDDKQDFKSTALKLNYHLPETRIGKNFKGLKISGAVEKGHSDDDKIFNPLDPNGDNLIIPGVGVGPSGVGFFLPGPNNQITNGIYDAEFDYYKIMLGISSDYQTTCDALTITPSLGVSYEHAKTKNNFSGTIPFFAREFTYNTTTKVKSISPIASLDASYAFNPTISVFGGVHYRYNFNSGSGLDNLSFTGFGTQTAVIDHDRNTDSYGIKAGVNIHFNLPIKLGLEGRYDIIGNVPVINARDGASVSSFSFKDADILSGTIRLSYQF
jgi:opacity protein-like surface antigen